MHVVVRANAAADGQRHETLRGGPFDHVDHRRAAVRARGDVEKDHFVRALVVVAERQFHRIADVAQPAFLGAAELHAARHFSIMNIEAGNDAFREHWAIDVFDRFATGTIGTRPELVNASP